MVLEAARKAERGIQANLARRGRLLVGESGRTREDNGSGKQGQLQNGD